VYGAQGPITLAGMPSSSTATAIVRPRQAPRDVKVRSWPLLEGDAGAWAALTATALLFVGAGYASQSVATGALVALIVLMGLWRLWLPVEFEISAAGVTQHVFGRSRRIPWSEIGRVERRPRGLLLLRDVTHSPLSPLRGLYLPYQQQKAEVLSIFEFYLDGRSGLG
jgi:hypothetical protein